IHKNKEVVFFYNMSNRPATSPSWKEYSFTGQADKDADTVVLGGFLMGKGSLLVDHVRLSVKEGNEWKDIPLENGSFEKKDSSNNDWHYNQRLAGYHYATETTDVQDGSRALAITSTQDAGHPSDEPNAQPLYDHYPRPGEYVQPILVPGISCTVPLALYGDKEHTWPMGDTNALALLKRRIQVAHPTTVNGDTLAVRLGGVIITWNVFRHFFAYWEDASATPDQLLEKGLTKAATDKNRYDFLQTLRLMTAPLNDGHINIFLQGDTIRQGYAPLVFAVAEGRLVIDKVLDSSLRPALAPGDVVSVINGQPAGSYLAGLDQYASGSPQLKVFRDLINLTVGPRDSLLTLGVVRADGAHNIKVERTMEWQAWNHAKSNRPSGWIKPGIFFIDIDRDPMDSINKWMPQLAKAKAIICDLRGYPNGNDGLIRHFLDKEEDTKWMFVPKITYPDYQHVTYNSGGWHLTPDSPHLQAKVFFLTDGSAISYAESYMGFIKDLHLATVVGQPTAGTNGNVNPFYLPGGFRVSFTGMLVKDHNGGKHHLKGIVPDVPVERTIKGIREGKDEFLEKAIRLAEEKNDGQAPNKLPLSSVKKSTPN
ncbi:MAG TPA: S41 family peptidase, partial [Puia sp.]|nr:S41 family peptidase [Puia sp.]